MKLSRSMGNQTESGESSVPETTAIAKRVTEFLSQNKADNIIEIDLNGKCSFAEVMIIASGTSQRFLQSLAHKTLKFLHDEGVKDVHAEGLNASDWVLIHCGGLIIHLFRPEVRELYNLEKMWAPKFGTQG